MTSESQHQVTRLLEEAYSGRKEAEQELFRLVHRELHDIAERRMRLENNGLACVKRMPRSRSSEGKTYRDRAVIRSRSLPTPNIPRGNVGSASAFDRANLLAAEQ
jgi:hypothetical protein